MNVNAISRSCLEYDVIPSKLGLYVTGAITECAVTTRPEMVVFRVGIDTDPLENKVIRPIIGANNALNLGNRR
mgnify:FL=1